MKKGWRWRKPEAPEYREIRSSFDPVTGTRVLSPGGGRLEAIAYDGDVIHRPTFDQMKALRRRNADELAAIIGTSSKYGRAQLDVLEFFRRRGGRHAASVTRSEIRESCAVTDAELDELIRDGMLSGKPGPHPLDPKGRPINTPAPAHGAENGSRGRCGETAGTCMPFAERGLAACGPCPLKNERFPISLGGKSAPRR
jgi:hypothetical protein